MWNENEKIHADPVPVLQRWIFHPISSSIIGEKKE